MPMEKPDGKTLVCGLWAIYLFNGTTLPSSLPAELTAGAEYNTDKFT